MVEQQYIPKNMIEIETCVLNKFDWYLVYIRFTCSTLLFCLWYKMIHVLESEADLRPEKSSTENVKTQGTCKSSKNISGT